MRPCRREPSDPAGQVVRSSLTIAADLLAVRELSGWLADLLAPTGSEAAELTTRIELAVHEVCMNVIDHAYGPHHVSQPGDLIIEGEVDAAAVRIDVRDRGASFSPEGVAKPVPEVPQIRGYGLIIVEKLADGLDYARQDDTNICSLRFDRHPTE